MTDNVAVLAGFTVAATVSYDLEVLVRPGTDFDSEFKAWDTDEQEYIRIKGWLATSIDVHK